MRVGILSLIHESNTFVGTPTTLDLFRRDGLLRGESIRERFAQGNHEISGFLEGLAAADMRRFEYRRRRRPLYPVEEIA